MQQYRVNNAEDRRIGPDAERQGEHGDRSEAGVLRQHAQGVFQVLEDCARRLPLLWFKICAVTLQVISG